MRCVFITEAVPSIVNVFVPLYHRHNQFNHHRCYHRSQRIRFLSVCVCVSVYSDGASSEFAGAVVVYNRCGPARLIFIAAAFGDNHALILSLSLLVPFVQGHMIIVISWMYYVML